MITPRILKLVATALDNLLAAQLQPGADQAAALVDAARQRLRTALAELDALAEPVTVAEELARR